MSEGTDNTEEILLDVRNLTVSYDGIPAIKGISFQVKRGEIFTLIGANGAGKSSTLRALSGLIRHGGEVIFSGENLRGIPADRIVARGLAHVPEGRGIFGNLTVLENLRLGAWLRRDRRGIQADIERVLDVLPRLRERLTQPSGTLSGGEQQMLAIARALMSRAKMLLLDEPSMGLAPKLIADIYRVLREVHAAGTTLLLVEQNANLALGLAHRAAVLETGEIPLCSDSATLRASPEVQRAYLGA
ncbi:MAG: ABC transporter ATP-binding protein [Chthoniobacterales bacterium]|nr:ABC transporter ATP-binding protein [Chthoniobacterales bacterium]